jgi:Cu+-exporting ATPase
MSATVNPVEMDPVCGMKIDASRAAATHDHAGKTYYFCCRGCQEKFRAEPSKYLASKPLIGIAPAASRMIQIAPARTDSPAGLADPVAQISAHAPEREIEYTCPMDLEVRERSPGDCPKCGMALEAASTSQVGTKTEYTCPMHPQIEKSDPGSCPICGMALETLTVAAEE